MKITPPRVKIPWFPTTLPPSLGTSKTLGLKASPCSNCSVNSYRLDILFFKGSAVPFLQDFLAR